MNQIVLVINCGSSSVKYALINENDPDHRISGLAEKLNTPDAVLKWTDLDGSKHEETIAGADHQKAIQVLLTKLGDHKPTLIGHRVVHGGEKFYKATLLNDEVIQTIQDTVSLAPLHNPANLAGIYATKTLFPHIPQVGVFDTAFHHTMPEKAYRYAIPAQLYTDYGIRRYGFHGTSHQYVSDRARELQGLKDAASGFLSAHLGNGCSTCAVADGKSMDTSMGLTPLEGVVMGTRSGDVDPGLHAFIARRLGWDLNTIDQMLNKGSGLLGLSELSNDMRTVEQAARDGNPKARLAIEVFCYRLAKSLSSMSTALPELSGIIFTGGIGENAPVIRQKTLEYLKHFGFEVNPQLNDSMVRGKEGRIDTGKGPAIWVIPTDEEGQIARESIACREQYPEKEQN